MLQTSSGTGFEALKRRAQRLALCPDLGNVDTNGQHFAT
jgi:hypothetical protein